MHATSDRRRNDGSIGPARRTAVIVSCLLLLGLVASFTNDLALPAQLSIAVAVLAMGTHAIWRLLRPRIAGLEIRGPRLRVRDACGARFSGVVVGIPFVSPFYVGFRWRQPDRRLPHSLGIFREQMSATDFRRLCATLRQQGEP